MTEEYNPIKFSTSDKNQFKLKRGKNMRRFFIPITALIITGCASVTNDTTHPIKIETLTETNETIDGAECKLTNDYGTIEMKSGNTTQVRRSSKDLDIICTHPDNPKAEARAISRANAGMFGNIIFGGGIGAIIDHNKGTAYTYPTWIKLIFGKMLIFDRSNEKNGQPTTALSPENIENKQ